MGRSRANNLFVAAFIGSWDGWTARYVAIGTEVWGFVEFKLRCCMRRWHFLVERGFGMRVSVRPGQYEK